MQRRRRGGRPLAIAACRVAEDEVLLAETSYWYAYLLAGQGASAEAVSLLAAIEALNPLWPRPA
ncbi:hypothetical protein [Rhizobium phaseoli]|uniref:hypothetical protein n=1 Tax=Rhizobium phaseoli TaxID=396 RepID=UPI001F30AFE1|nr:hypothetical protein [Rhizobium phaseoli]